MMKDINKRFDGTWIILLATILFSGSLFQVSGQQSQDRMILSENYPGSKSFYEIPVTIQVEETSISQVFQELEKQMMGLRFLYNNEVIEKSPHQLNLNFTAATAADVLMEISNQTGLRFRQINRIISVGISELREPALTEIEQQETVRGTVRDAQTGEVLPGVNIIIEGTSTGTSTDPDGNFELEVPNLQETLIFTYIGYDRLEVQLEGRSELNIDMIPSILAGDELVVVGYGIVRKSDLTGSVGTIDSQEITERDNIKLSDALQGKVAGLQVHSGSGEPGREPKVRLRGINSINAGIDPLYVVDGISGVDITMIDPNTIESVQVLKDASATAIYGARGSNGVILITTKRGSQDGLEVTFKTNVTNSHMYRYIDLLNSEEFMDMHDQAMENAANKYDPGGVYNKVDRSDYPRLFDQNGNPRYDTDWQKEGYPSSWSNTHSLMIQGGDERTVYSFSGGYTNTNGILIGNNYRRQNGKLTIDSEALPWLHFGGSLRASKSRNKIPGASYSMTRNIAEMLPMIPVKFPDGSWGANEEFPGTEFQKSPVDQAQNRNTVENKNELNGDVYTRIQLNNSLEFTTSYSFIEENEKDNTYTARRLTGTTNGVANIGTRKRSYWQSESQFNWAETFGDINITGLLGMTWLEDQSEFTRVSGRGFLDDYYQWRNIPAADIITRGDIGGSTTQSSLNSYFSRINLNLKEKYLVTLTGRYDGSSVFGKDNKYAFFPSVALGWRISGESFMSSVDYISNLKLRVSVGSVGNQQIRSYSSQRFLGIQNVLFGDGQALGITQTSFGNSELKWETTDQYNIGLELGLIEDRIQLEADLYYKKTKDMLFNRPVPRSTGFGTVVENIGDMENKGVEISLTSHNITGSGFTWTSNINWAANRNKILKLGAFDEDIFPGPWFIGETNILRVGEAVGSLFGFESLGTWNTEEADEAAIYGLLPGDIKYADLNNDGVIDDKDHKILGNSYPLWEANIVNTLNYNNFDLSLNFRIVYGADIMDGTQHSSVEYQTLNNGYGALRDAWRPDNQDTNVPQVRAWGAPFQSRTSSRWLYDGSFIRAQNLTVGYSLPQSLLQKGGINNLRLYVSAQNLFVITPYPGYDPEAIGQRGWTEGNQLTQNFHFHQYPKPRTVRLGINLSF